MFFTEEQLNIIDFCAQECAHQESGELSVARMIRAWDEYHPIPSDYRIIDWEMIVDWATIIEPQNHCDYRTVPVVIRGRLLGWENIRHQMEMLLAAQSNLTPEEFYKEFEEIHPFVDGNGRTGAILYNYLRGTMNDPIFPPNFWKE